ncbi:MAG: lipopolysaccharide biosynthesis protein [Candidatus Thorarchaeota archaeon]|jgi:O-antigen/teichoic acid export membrane protein
MKDQKTISDLGPDSLSTNVLSEGFSRALSFLAGLASSVLLVRSVDPTSLLWTSAEYNSVKYLTALSSILLPMILFGMTTAVIKIVSEYDNEKERITEIVTFAFSLIIGIYIVTILLTWIFGDSIGWLAIRPDLKVYWILVLISLLPISLFQLSSAVFSGLQRMKFNLVSNSVYNAVRLVLLVYLFVSEGFSISSMMWVIILFTISGTVCALTLLFREMKRRNLLRLSFPSSTLVRYIMSIGATFVILSLLSANVNQVPIVFADLFKASEAEYLNFNVSQSITMTLRQILMAPVAVLMPNLSLIMSSKGIADVRKRFNEIGRILMPTYLFASVVVYVFGYAFLGVLYGNEYAIAAPFLQAFSFNIFVAGLTNIYSILITSMGRMKALVLMGVSQALIQTIWILILAPIFGIIIIAYWWVTFIPLYLIQHYYTRTRFQVTIRARLILRSLVVGVATFIIGLVTSEFVKGALSFLPFITNELYYLVILSSIVPLWYVFLALSVLGGLIDRNDIANLSKFFRRIPPLWWISKPILGRIQKLRSR